MGAEQQRVMEVEMRRGGGSGTGFRGVGWFILCVGGCLSRYSGRLRMGRTGAVGTDWVSETSMVCKVAGGTEGSLMAVVSVGERSGSTTEASSYDVGTGSIWNVGNEATTGGASVSVVGSSFGSAR